MLWLTLDEVNAQNFQVRGSPTPQEIVFPADLDKLKAQIPLDRTLRTRDLYRVHRYQWFAWIGRRPLILEWRVAHPSAFSVGQPN